MRTNLVAKVHLADRARYYPVVSVEADKAFILHEGKLKPIDVLGDEYFLLFHKDGQPADTLPGEHERNQARESRDKRFRQLLRRMMRELTEEPSAPTKPPVPDEEPPPKPREHVPPTIADKLPIRRTTVPQDKS